MHPLAVNQFIPTVNPSEAECLLHGIKIPEMLVIYRSSPFHVNPAFSFAGVVGFEPCTELTSVGYTEDVMLFHKFGFNALKLIIIRHLSKRKARWSESRGPDRFRSQSRRLRLAATGRGADVPIGLHLQNRYSGKSRNFVKILYSGVRSLYVFAVAEDSVND